MRYADFITRFDRREKETERGCLVLCPAHADKNPSLSVGRGSDGRVVLKCFAGCDTRDVVAAMGLTMADLFASESKVNGNGSNHPPGKSIFRKRLEAAVKGKDKANPARAEVECCYSYTDALGRELYQAVRMRPKSFRQRHKVGGEWVWNMDGVERVLYRLPEVERAQEVWVVEGEKDADTLAELGFCATTNVGGAGKWLDGYTATLEGKDVVLCGDNDDPGREHVEKVFDSVATKAKSVRLVTVPAPHKDVSEFAAADAAGVIAALKALATAAVPHYGGVRMSVYTMAELMPRYVEQVSLAAEVSADLSRWLPSLRKLRPLTPGSFVLFVADTGVGKTNLLLNVAAVFPYLPTLFFELELPGEEIYERAWARRANLDGRDVEEEHKRGGFDAAAVQAQFPNLFICTEPSLTVPQLEGIVSKSELKMGCKPRLVMLDYVQLLRGRGERYERTSDAAESLKLMAKSTRTILFVASQVDRASGRSGNIGLHSGKDSGSLENSASVVITAERDDKDPTLMRLRVVKATKGGSGTEVLCNYDGARSTITEREV